MTKKHKKTINVNDSKNEYRKAFFNSNRTSKNEKNILDSRYKEMMDKIKIYELLSNVMSRLFKKEMFVEMFNISKSVETTKKVGIKAIIV